jgi:hypothetical protein
MTKNWYYVLMVVAIIGMAAVAGSVMTDNQRTTAAPEPAVPAPDRVMPGISPYSGYSMNTAPLFAWFVTTYNTDPSSTLVYTVPSGKKLQLENVFISNPSIDTNVAYLYRGPLGDVPLIMTGLGPSDHVELTLKNVVLNSNEKLKVSNGFGDIVSWTITGHWV